MDEMTSKAESLAEAIMKMAEEDKGLVKSKLIEMIEAQPISSDYIVELSKRLREQREKEARRFFQDAIAAKDAEIEFRQLTHEELYGSARK